MSQVEVVALWAGLIASIAGIVLSIAALVFGVWVNNRATEVNDQTIKSLQKIESAVERLSDDTRSLIKAGWDKMLNNVAAPATDGEDTTQDVADRLASGLAEEARADIGLRGEPNESGDDTSQDKLERIELALQNLEQSVATQFKNLGGRSGRAQVVDQLVSKILNLSPEARAMISILVDGRHLDHKQYQKLNRSPFGLSLRELRKAGFLVPLSGTGSDGKKVPVYWLPPGQSKAVLAATMLVPEPDKEMTEKLREALRKVDYDPN